MYYLLFRIFQQLALALKNAVDLKFFTLLNMNFLSFRIFEQLALRNRVFPEIFHCIEYVFFIIQDFWATCACPEKQRCPGIFHLYWNNFNHSGFLSNLRLPWKQSLPSNFSLYWIYLLHSGVLSNLPWKTELPWNFSPVLKYFLSFRILAISACPENRVCPEIFQSRGGGCPPSLPALYAYAIQQHR